MPDVTIVYWRDIPAQIIVGKGRRGAKAALPERFEQPIDRCAIDGRVRMIQWGCAVLLAASALAQSRF